MTHLDKGPRPLASRPVLAMAPEPGGEEVDAMALVRLVRRRIGLIALLTLAAVLAATPLILSVDKIYYAQSRLLIQAPLTSGLADPEAPPPPELNLTTEVERLLARDIAAAVIRTLDLGEREEFNPALRETSILNRWREALRALVAGDEGAAAEARPRDPLDAVLPEFYGALSVWHNANSQVITIGFRSRDPALAAEVPNQLLRIYLAERLSRHRARLDDAEQWLSARLSEQLARLVAARRALQEGLEAAAQAASEGQLAQGEAASALAERRAALVQERAGLEAKLSELTGEGAAPGRVDTEVMAGLQRQLEGERRELDALLRVYGDNHLSVRAARDRIADLRAAMAAEVESHVEIQRTRLASIGAEEEAVIAALEEAHASLSRFSVTEAELDSLREAALREQGTLDRLEQQRRTLLVQAQQPEIEAEILAQASVPLWPEGRSRLLYLAGAAVAALAVALSVACLLEVLDRSVRSHQQLGGIPNLVSGALVPISRRRVRPANALGRRPDPSFSNGIRNAVLALGEAGDGGEPRSLLVTATAPGEGTTTIATEIALEMAASGRRVLLVDANLERGRLHSVFAGAPGPGLSEYLTRERDLEAVVRQHAASGLHYIPRGLRASMPLSDRHMIGDLLRSAERQGRMVIFDTAPVLGSPDTAQLAAMADRAVLVVRWGRTHRHAVEAAAQRLGGSGGKPVVTVINMVEPRRHALYGFTDAELFNRKLRRSSPRAA